MKRGSADASDPGRLELREQAAAATGEVPGPAKASWWRLAHVGLLTVTALFFALHFVHLSADFPNYSPWMDWSKYTDEGWYGDAAIRQMEFRDWYVKGDFNPGVALPVWPVLEYGVFRITGVGLVAARALSVAVFGAILVCVYVLMGRFSRRGGTSFVPAAAVALLAVSPFCYVFTRLAILEPLLVLLGLMAVLAASHVRTRVVVPIVGLGILLPLMILTKTTAVFLLPSVAWMLWASVGYRPTAFLRVGVPAAGVAAGLWLAYFGLFVRPRFLEDYRYLFSANAYTGMTRENALSVIATTFQDGMWMGRLVYPLALIAVVAAMVWWRRCLQSPLVPALILWAGGYAGFLAYHNNLQPRYYLVIAVPLTMLIPVIAEQLLESAAGYRREVAAVAFVALVVVIATDASQTLHYVRNPEYTFVEAARSLKRVVTSDTTGRSRLVLSISGSDLSLMTGLPSICDDFGTMSLEQRVATYKPGWYAAWNEVDDDKMDALSPMFHLTRVAEFPAFDDPERNLLILYRLDPPEAEMPRGRHRKGVPKRLQTKIGQQPSASQLEH